MVNDWIVEVLNDLKCFADQNGLALLAHQLETTKKVAQAEIAALPPPGERHSGPRKM